MVVVSSPYTALFYSSLHDPAFQLTRDTKAGNRGAFAPADVPRLIQFSMSAKGNAYDNAKAESFFKTLKQEEVYLKQYQTFQEVHKNSVQFIDEVYNLKRLHSSLGCVPPVEFETAYYQGIQC